MRALTDIAFALFAFILFAAYSHNRTPTIEGAWRNDQTGRTISISRHGGEWTVSGFLSPDVLVTRATDRYIWLVAQPAPNRREEFMLELSEDSQSLKGRHFVVLDLGGTETRGESQIAWRRVHTAEAERGPPPSGTDDGRFSALPQLALLKAKIYKTVGAKGYVVNTDAHGKVVGTTDATDYTIRDIQFDPTTGIAAVVLISSNHTIVLKQEWRHVQDDWRPNNPDSGINKLKQNP